MILIGFKFFKVDFEQISIEFCVQEKVSDWRGALLPPRLDVVAENAVTAALANGKRWALALQQLATVATPGERRE